MKKRDPREADVAWLQKKAARWWDGLDPKLKRKINRRDALEANHRWLRLACRLSGHLFGLILGLNIGAAMMRAEAGGVPFAAAIVIFLAGYFVVDAWETRVRRRVEELEAEAQTDLVKELQAKP